MRASSSKPSEEPPEGPEPLSGPAPRAKEGQDPDGDARLQGLLGICRLAAWLVLVTAAVPAALMLAEGPVMAFLNARPSHEAMALPLLLSLLAPFAIAPIAVLATRHKADEKASVEAAGRRWQKAVRRTSRSPLTWAAVGALLLWAFLLFGPSNLGSRLVAYIAFSNPFRCHCGWTAESGRPHPGHP